MRCIDTASDMSSDGELPPHPEETAEAIRLT
jgi:hypothetical protein